MIIKDSLGKAGNIMDLLSAKQQVIAENLANMHTPGYQRKDVNFAQFLNSGEDSLETKLSRKMGSSPISIEQGGDVAPAQEMMEMQKVQVYYTIAARQMTSVIQELKQVTQTR